MMFAVLSLPNPLHPALVHFPIVLLLLGAAVAVPAALFARWKLPLLAAILLSLGTVGTIVARQTGEEEGERIGETPASEQILDQHEKWAERTQVVAIVAAVLAIGVLFTSRWSMVASGLGAATALAALVATWCVAETGHYGGQLVYRHGAGVNLAPAANGSAPEGKSAPERRSHREREET
jgi:uncharacterized membrane protein